MGASTGLTVKQARVQDAYFTKLRTAAQAIHAREDAVACPRAGCEGHVHTSDANKLTVIRCSDCGIIYRGSGATLLSEF